MSKTITIKVFDKSGNFIGFWDKAIFRSFTKKLNSGLGNCTITLGKEFEWEDATLKENNEVQIYVSDEDTTGETNGERKIYSGYISNYTPSIDGGQENIEVNLLGYHTKLSQDIYKNDTTVIIGESATDVGVIAKNIIDRYQAENSNTRIYYTDNSVEETGTNATYNFVWAYYMDAIATTLSFAPADYFWYVDENNIFYFKDRPATATHEFVFGKHFKSIQINHSMEKIYNALLLSAPGVASLLKLYSDATSIDTYGRRIFKITDNNISDSTTADLIGSNFIENNKNPIISVEIEILDNNFSSLFGYDIESISPGDTCLFRGFTAEISDLLGDNMLITSVSYNLDKVSVTIQPSKSGLINLVTLNKKGIEELNVDSLVSTYTT